MRFMGIVVVAVALSSCGGRSQLGTVVFEDFDASAPLPSKDASVLCRDEVIATGSELMQGATAVAIEGDRIFWGTANGEVWARQNGAVTQLATEPFWIRAIVADPSSMYFASSGSIFSASMGMVAPLVSNQGDDPDVLAADNDAIYYLDYTGNRLVRVDRTSKATQVLLTGFGSGIRGMTVDDTSVYVSGGAANHAYILRLPKTGGDVQRIASNLSLPSPLVVDATQVFFLEQSINNSVAGLRSVLKTGGPITTVAAIPESPYDFTIDATHAYVSTNERGVKWPRTQIRRIALDGSKNEVWVFATDALMFRMIRNDANAVYWTIGFEGVVPPGTTTVQKKCK